MKWAHNLFSRAFGAARFIRQKKVWLQSCILAVISYRGAEQGVGKLLRVSTAGKNHGLVSATSAVQRDLLVGRPMWSVGRGFTIIEVMIVLAISGVIFAGGIVALHGQTNTKAFDESIQDTSSELSNQIRGASSTQFFNNTGYSCNVTGTPPRATLTSDPATQNQCVALGLAVEAPSNSADPVPAVLYFYQILGNRLQYIGGQPAGQANSLASSNPTPAVANGNYLLTSYKLSGGVKLVSAKATPVSGGTFDSNLAGFYLDYNSGAVAGSNGSQTASGQAYSGTTSTHNPAGVKACVEAPACGPQPISAWTLCFQNDAGDRKAEIDIKNSPTGLSTELKFANCN